MGCSGYFSSFDPKNTQQCFEAFSDEPHQRKRNGTLKKRLSWLWGRADVVDTKDNNLHKDPF